MEYRTDPPVATVSTASETPRLSIGHRVVLSLSFILLAAFAMRQLSSSDVGFHLKAGNFILDGNGWPRTDPFTYTLGDRPYIDTSWGYQVLLALAHRAADAPGIVCFHAVLLLAIFFTVYRTARIGAPDPTTLAVCMSAGVIACEMRCEARPELLSLLILSILLHVLTRRAEGLPSPLWLLPMLHLIWANCHSFFILGWVVMGAFIVGMAAARRRIDGPLLKWAAASALICILNPYGLTGILFPLSLLTRFDQSNVFAQSIGELCSPFAPRLSVTMPFYPVWPIWTFRVLAAMSLVSVFLLWYHRRYWSVLLWALFLLITWQMLRNMPLFVVAVLPGIARTWSFAGACRFLRVRKRAALWGGRALLAVAAFIVVTLSISTITNAYYLDDRRSQRFGWDWNRLELPVDAAEYAREAGLSGPMLNHLNFGAYLMWALPQPVFIDGRLEVVGEQFYLEYLKIFDTPEALESAVAKHGIRWIVFPYAVATKLLGRLSIDSRWRLAYFDHLATIFVRSSPDAARYVDPALTADKDAKPMRVDVASLPGLGGGARAAGLARWWNGLRGRQRFDRVRYCRGLFHYWRGELDMAAAAFAEVIAGSGGAYYEVYNNLGASLWRLGRRNEAAACYRIVLQDDPSNQLARERARGSMIP